MQATSRVPIFPAARAALWRPRLALRLACAFWATCLDCCRRGYTAAADYEELARLSPEELKRRGIAEGDLLKAIGEYLGGRCSR